MAGTRLIGLHSSADFEEELKNSQSVLFFITEIEIFPKNIGRYYDKNHYTDYAVYCKHNRIYQDS